MMSYLMSDVTIVSDPFYTVLLKVGAFSLSGTILKEKNPSTI